MEWSFVVAAVRRRLKFVVLCAIVGALPGIYLISNAEQEYVATSTMSIAAPSTGAIAASAANQPDRYIVSQISVVRSTDTLKDAADKIGGDITAGAIASMITVDQEPSTDIITITATTGDPNVAATVANAVAEVYIEGASTRATAARQPEIDRLNLKLTELATAIKVQTDAIDAAMAPFLESTNTTRGVPQPESVAPAAVQEKNILNAEYARIQSARSDIELSANNQATSALIERAVAPGTPKGTLGPVALVGGIGFGALVGVATALVLAQLSSKVLDETSVANTLGSTVVGAFPRSRALANHPIAALETTPADAGETLERLSVRAEAMADPDIDQALTIAVVGTQPGAGTTTLTLALARRLALSGYSVVVVDGDLRTQTISETFETKATAGISAVLAAEVKKPVKPVEYFTPTPLPKVEILGVGRIKRRENLRRDAIAPVLDVARDRGQIVLFDGGSLLGSALTLFASKAADVIVLAVPLLEQDSEGLAEIADHLPTDRSRVLAVITSPIRRRSRAAERPEAVETPEVPKVTKVTKAAS